MNNVYAKLKNASNFMKGTRKTFNFILRRFLYER